MIYCLLASLLARLLDLATLTRCDPRERELEILLLRHQFRILQRAQARRVRPSRREKLTLAVVAASLQRHARGACVAWRGSLLLFSPELVLKWHRELVRRKWTFRRRRAGGRPAISGDLDALILSERHLRRVLTTYIAFFNHRRPHQGLDQRSPVPQVAGPPDGATRRRDILGGIIHDYERLAA
jgi:hypothetical protein